MRWLSLAGRIVRRRRVATTEKLSLATPAAAEARGDELGLRVFLAPVLEDDRQARENRDLSILAAFRDPELAMSKVPADEDDSGVATLSLGTTASPTVTRGGLSRGAWRCSGPPDSSPGERPNRRHAIVAALLPLTKQSRSSNRSRSLRRSSACATACWNSGASCRLMVSISGSIPAASVSVLSSSRFSAVRERPHDSASRMDATATQLSRGPRPPYCPSLGNRAGPSPTRRLWRTAGYAARPRAGFVRPRLKYRTSARRNMLIACSGRPISLRTHPRFESCRATSGCFWPERLRHPQSVLHERQRLFELTLLQLHCSLVLREPRPDVGMSTTQAIENSVSNPNPRTALRMPTLSVSDGEAQPGSGRRRRFIVTTRFGDGQGVEQDVLCLLRVSNRVHDVPRDIKKLSQQGLVVGSFDRAPNRVAFRKRLLLEPGLKQKSYFLYRLREGADFRQRLLVARQLQERMEDGGVGATGQRRELASCRQGLGRAPAVAAARENVRHGRDVAEIVVEASHPQIQKLRGLLATRVRGLARFGIGVDPPTNVIIETRSKAVPGLFGVRDATGEECAMDRLTPPIGRRVERPRCRYPVGRWTAIESPRAGGAPRSRASPKSMTRTEPSVAIMTL